MATRDDRAAMGGEERCIHELIRQHCGYCRTPPPPRFMEALFDTPGDEDVIPASFPARFGGLCAQCDDYFEEGDWISRTSSGDYVCLDCAR